MDRHKPSSVTSIRCIFAVNDTQTAEQISNRLGEETILVTSGGTSSGSSWQHSDGQQASRSLGGSSNSNDNWAQQPRKLLKPEEVLALPPRTAITFTAGFPPICTQLIWQHEEKNLGQQPAPKRPALTQTITLAGWSLRWALMLFLAGCITAGIAQRFSPRAQILPERKIVDPNDNYWKRR
jgi:type IV secretory pathway TraG/TraD family ATPase VirD4